jgi:hypothetical protein
VEALVADGTVDASRSGFVHARDLAAAAPRDVVLVDGVPLPEGALRPGAWIFLAPLGGPLPFEAGAPIEDPLVWRTAGDHPVVADLDFRRAFAARAWPLSGAGLEPLAFAGGEPVAAEGEARGVRYVVLGLDPEASALPVQAALPLFVRRALLRLWRGTRGALAPLYHTDDPLRPAADLPGGPAALVAWSGPATDPVLAAAARGREAARIAPEGTAWRVPPGASGRATVTTRGDPPWEGRTAFFDRDPGRTVVPARPPAAPPPPAAAPAAAPAAWRRGLLAAALLLLLADVGLVWVARRGNAARS